RRSRLSFPTRRSSDMDLHALDGRLDLVREVGGDLVPVGVVTPRVLDGLVGGPGGQVEVIVTGHCAFPSAVAPCDAAVPSVSATRDRKSTRLNSSHVSI